MSDLEKKETIIVRNIARYYNRMSGTVWIPNDIIDLIVIFHGIFNTSFESNILSNDAMKEELMRLICGELTRNVVINRIYCGSIDGFRSYVFHDKCDDKGQTISLILNEYNTIFGGYASVSWTKNMGCKNDKNAFLFQLSPNKTIIKQKRKDGFKALFNRAGIMCGFSGWCDMVIKSDCNVSKNSYAWPGDYNFVTQNANELIGGNGQIKSKIFFKVNEIEVFKLEN